MSELYGSVNFKSPRVVFSDSWSYFFIMFAVCACAFPNYDAFTFFKVLLLAYSLVILCFAKIFLYLKKDSFLFAYLLYFGFLLLNVREIDSFSLRLIFNGGVIIVACYAATFLRYKLEHFLLGIFIASLFFVYAYFLNVNEVDGKQQVHAQLLNIFYMLIIICNARSLYFIFSSIMLIAFSKVRSAMFGFSALLGFFYFPLKGRSPNFRLTALLLMMTLVFIALIYSVDYLREIFGARIDSFMWRLLHWSNVFKDFTIFDWVFGKGLGYSWRTTLNFDSFYSVGGSFVATHSNYVKIIADTGLIGLVAFLILIYYLFGRGNFTVKTVIVFYLGYGFFDEGIWHFDMFWFLVLVLNGYGGRYAVSPNHNKG